MFGLVQAPKRDPLDSLLAVKIGQHLGERMAARQVGLAIGGDQERGHVLALGRDVPQEQKRRLVGPVEVVQDQDDRLLARGLAKQSPHRAPKQVALGVGVGLARRRNVGEALPERRHEAGELAAVALDVGAKDPLGGVLDVVGERLDPGPVGDAKLLLRASVEHDRATGARLEGGVGGEAGLSYPGLAREEREAPLSLACLREERSKALALGRAPDEADRREAPGGEAEAAARAPLPSGSQATSTAASGSGRPFSSRAPTGLKASPARPPARWATISLARIWPPEARSQRRAASITGMPK